MDLRFKPLHLSSCSKSVTLHILASVLSSAQALPSISYLSPGPCCQSDLPLTSNIQLLPKVLTPLHQSDLSLDSYSLAPAISQLFTEILTYAISQTSS